MSELTIKQRFDGYLPVVIDVETSGVEAEKNALLEIAAVSVDYNQDGSIAPVEAHYVAHIEPFDGAVLDPEALKITGIRPDNPFRKTIAQTEQQALTGLFDYISAALKASGCRRALLVGHNAHFDLGFVQAAMRRCRISQSPLHAFTVMDTATLSGVFYGKTVLAKALKEAEIEFNCDKAHSALYDTLKTAELFCRAVNQISAK